MPFVITRLFQQMQSLDVQRRLQASFGIVTLQCRILLHSHLAVMYFFTTRMLFVELILLELPILPGMAAYVLKIQIRTYQQGRRTYWPTPLNF